MTISFEVPGTPVPQSRPRVSRYGTYYPPKVKAYREYVSTIAKAAMGGREPLQGALEMSCTFYFTPPKSTPKKTLSAMYGTYHTRKPDADNLLKCVQDSLNGICYVDDSQIAVLHASKVYADEARVEIVIVRDSAEMT